MNIFIGAGKEEENGRNRERARGETETQVKSRQARTLTIALGDPRTTGWDRDSFFWPPRSKDKKLKKKCRSLVYGGTFPFEAKITF